MKFNPSVTAAVEEQLEGEGAVKAIKELAESLAANQFGADHVDKMGAAALCLSAGSQLLLDAVRASHPDAKSRESLDHLAFMVGLGPLMMKHKLGAAVNARKAEFDLK
tara:strand:- start:1639 stop:1962 length:324 start_codon:yes stop_codon:yes gene_type:complete